ncbi:hypothetical protein M2271_004752 [Streptomyces sp. LBL]|nr:hypothetical protein [Streptomyces sp. LBL]
MEDTVGVEAADLGVDGVVELRVGHRCAASDDPAEPFVVRHLPADQHPFPREAAVGLVRGGSEPGPQEHGGGQRVAGGHAEGEGVLTDLRGVELGGARGAGGGQVHGDGERGGGSGDGQETAAADVPGGRAQFGGMLGRVCCGCHPVLP